MSPEVLQSEFRDILEKSVLTRPLEGDAVQLDESQMFQLWNLLGEELGIDLSIPSREMREMLFAACKSGRHFSSRDFGSLLWLVYYSDDKIQ